MSWFFTPNLTVLPDALCAEVCMCDWQVCEGNWLQSPLCHLHASLQSTSSLPLCTIFFFPSSNSFHSVIELLLLCFFFSTSLSWIVGRRLLEMVSRGTLQTLCKALRIPAPASPGQPAVPHGDIAASKPQIFSPLFFLCLPLHFSVSFSVVALPAASNV